jgi:hypothetical protein
MATNPAAFSGSVGGSFSHMDVAVDSYSPEPQTDENIGESELRQQLEEYVRELEAMNFPMP